MGMVLRLETSENNEFSKSVKFFWTFFGGKNGLKMTFQVIPKAENLHAPRYNPGKQFWNLVEGYLSLIFEAFPQYIFQKTPPKGTFKGTHINPLKINMHEPGHPCHLF